MINFEKVIRRISYKPNWSLKITPDWKFSPHEQHYTLVCTMLVPNVENPLHTTPVTGHFRIEQGQFADERHFINFVRDKIMEIESHEVDEWFCVDEYQVKNPHDGTPLRIPNPRATPMFQPRPHAPFVLLDEPIPHHSNLDVYRRYMQPLYEQMLPYQSRPADTEPSKPLPLTQLQKNILDAVKGEERKFFERFLPKKKRKQNPQDT